MRVKTQITNPIRETVVLMDNVNILINEVESEDYLEAEYIMSQLKDKFESLEEREILSEKTWDMFKKNSTSLVEALFIGSVDKEKALEDLDRLKHLIEGRLVDDVAIYIQEGWKR